MEGILENVQGEARIPLGALALKRSVRSLHRGWILVNWRGKDHACRVNGLSGVKASGGPLQPGGVYIV
jgi:hypothetical protein